MSRADVLQVWEVVRSNPRLKKFVVPVVIGMIAMICATICAAPYWFTGGAIHNAHLTQNVGLDLNLSGFSWGSRMIMARGGQTIQVEIDVHEVNRGGLYVRLNCNGLVNRDEWKSMNINTVGKHKITLVASQSANYNLELSPRGDINNALDMLSGGQCDLKYSATWDVF